MQLGIVQASCGAALAAIVFIGCGTARAEQVLNAGGWTITAPNGIALVSDGVVNGTLRLEKEAAFPSSMPLGINFAPGAGAVSSIEITDEVVNNLSGSTWKGFDFQLTGPATFTGAFAAPGTQQGGTFSTMVFTPTEVAYGGGSQPSGAVPMFWGQEVSPLAGELIFGPTSPGAPFVLYEEPVASVPLPAAAWQTLSGLGLIGFVGILRKSWRSGSKRARHVA